MEYLFFLGGVLLGAILSRILYDLRKAQGWFDIREAEDGSYINVHLPTNADYNKTKYIVLTRITHK